MTNKTNSERYKESFDRLHLSEDFRTRLAGALEHEREDSKMNNIRVFSIGRIAAAAAAFTLLCGSVCYAADLGGIRTNLQLWISGKSRNVEVTDMGNGTFAWTDDSGVNHGFGGFTSTEDGVVTAMPSGDIVTYMNNSAELEFKDGRVLFHYHNISEDVTDKIGADRTLKIHVADPANPNTYFKFEAISNGTYSVECSPKASNGAEYYEADATGLISEDPVEALDEDTEIEITTQITE